MGGSASKAARKYPARPSNASQAVFQNGTKPVRPRTEPENSNSRFAAEHRTIEKDGADPQFLSNLSRLGQVQVNHNMQSIRPPAIQAFFTLALSDLLDRRKSAKSGKELRDLAQEFAIDMDKLESLTRFVNSPSVDSSTIRPAAGKTEEEGFIATAVWVEPKLKG
ncbi:hypothetical protein GALMADRAFT_607756 [Galerina marginata CBS 339.88]|uniref:Uncharacterized protein n=1 Tax=Galerina marginata (strain CBS 339.88) TaxID=685588 RepID=A0A067STP7_GALM3|nr:hypothetical protein GALMADRAFT_607756 [Galerina marginata CBS 339.88]